MSDSRTANWQQRIRIFEDTLDWIMTDDDLSVSVSNARKNTAVYYENDYPVFSRPEAA